MAGSAAGSSGFAGVIEWWPPPEARSARSSAWAASTWDVHMKHKGRSMCTFAKRLCVQALRLTTDKPLNGASISDHACLAMKARNSPSGAVVAQIQDV